MCPASAPAAWGPGSALLALVTQSALLRQRALWFVTLFLLPHLLTVAQPGPKAGGLSWCTVALGIRAAGSVPQPESICQATVPTPCRVWDPALTASLVVSVRC